MSKEMIIASSRHETKIALTEEGQVVEVYIEREKEVGLAGSIYKGRVTRVLPGMQSAFVDIGLDRDAFLYVSDFSENLEGLDSGPGETDSEEETKTPVRRRRQSSGRRSRRTRSPRRARTEKSAEESPGETAEAAPEPVPEETTTVETATTAETVAEAPDGGAGRTEPEVSPDKAAAAESPDLALPETKPEGRSRTRRPRRTRGGRGRGGRTESGSGRTSRSTRPASEPLEPPKAEAFVLPGESIAAFSGPAASDTAGKESAAEEVAQTAPAEAAAEVSEPDTSAAEAVEAAKTGSEDSTADETYEPGSSELEANDEALPAAETAAEKNTETEIPAADSEEEDGKTATADKETGATQEETEPEEADDSVSNGINLFPTEAISTDTREDLDETLAEMERVRRYEDEVGLPPSLEERTGGGVEWPEELEEAEADATEDEAELDITLEETGDSGEEVLELDLEPGEPGLDEGLAEGAEDTEKKPDEIEPTKAASARKRSRRAPVKRGRQTKARSGTRRTGRASGDSRTTGRKRAAGRATGTRRTTGRGRPQKRHTSARPSRGQPAIADLLKAGQEIIVQIAKEQIGQKGARITSHVTLPGRFLVYMPTIDHIGVSRKIGTAEERARLRRSLIEMKGEAGGGFVVRTAASNCTDDELRTDVDYLVNLWRNMVKDAEEQKSPALLHRDLDVTQRLLRDQLSSDYGNVWIDSEEEYTRIIEFVGKFLPKLAKKVKLYTRNEPIFEEMGVQQEIERALRPKVWLKSGGYIVINQTEALVAIDINTGKFVGKGSTRLEDTIVKTNIEAIQEIVRQIRLRDLGGILVIDFIDMEDRRNRNKVMRELERALYVDRQPSKILSFNEFGLVAITRKRSRQSLERVLCQPCPYCTGVGSLKSVQTLCIEIQDHARRMAGEIDAPELTIRANPDIISALKGDVSALVRELEEDLDKSIILQPDESLHFENYNIF